MNLYEEKLSGFSACPFVEKIGSISEKSKTFTADKRANIKFSRVRHTVAALDIEAAMFIDHIIHRKMFHDHIRNGTTIEMSLNRLKLGTHQGKVFLDASKSVYA